MIVRDPYSQNGTRIILIVLQRNIAMAASIWVQVSIRLQAAVGKSRNTEAIRSRSIASIAVCTFLRGTGSHGSISTAKGALEGWTRHRAFKKAAVVVVIFALVLAAAVEAEPNNSGDDYSHTSNTSNDDASNGTTRYGRTTVF